MLEISCKYSIIFPTQIRIGFVLVGLVFFFSFLSEKLASRLQSLKRGSSRKQSKKRGEWARDLVHWDNPFHEGGGHPVGWSITNSRSPIKLKISSSRQEMDVFGGSSLNLYYLEICRVIRTNPFGIDLKLEIGLVVIGSRYILLLRSEFDLVFHYILESTPYVHTLSSELLSFNFALRLSNWLEFEFHYFLNILKMEHQKMKVCVTSGTRCCVQKNADRISELPDELLVLILSRLTINEAVRTGILSHRWEGLWKYFTGSFDFRDTNLVVDGINYVQWVNHLLSSHRGPTLDAFRVFYRLDKRFEKIINSWIDFAIKKEVGILQLDLGRRLDDDNWTFPSLPDLAFSNFRSLSALYLSHINVTDQAVADILSNCLLLEELCVRSSKSLVDVNVAGPNSLKLKHLEISKCLNLKSVGISSVNLVSFKFLGGKIALSVKNAPRLSQLDIGGDYCDFLVSDLGRLLLVQPSQLERLILDFSAMHPREAMLVFVKGFPEFPNLKYLELGLKLEARDKYSILFLTSMIEACPCLQSFRLEVTSFWLCRFESTPRRRYLADDMWTRVSQRKPCQEDIMSLDAVDPNFPIGSAHHQGFLYKHLEVVGLGGFSGHPAELELAMYLLEIAALRLEKVIIDPRHRDFPSILMVPKKVKAAREQAKQLETKLSSAATTKLEIL